jgi:hypothetical protein
MIARRATNEPSRGRSTGSWADGDLWSKVGVYKGLEEARFKTLRLLCCLFEGCRYTIKVYVAVYVCY